ncbi:putative Polysacc_synt_C domain-containing protein [Gammaproteobacteria bacterium]
MNNITKRFRTLILGNGLHALVARGASGAFIAHLGGVLAAFGVQIVLARLLGATRYGDFIYAFSVASLAATWLKLGLDAGIIRFVPAYRAQGEWGLIRGLLIRSLQTMLLTGSVVVIVSSIALQIWSTRLGPELKSTLQIASFLVPVMMLQFLFESRLRAFDRVFFARLPHEVVQPTLQIILVAGAAGFTTLTLEADQVMMLTVASVLLSLGLGQIFFRRFAPTEISIAPPEYRTRTWITTAIQLSLFSSMLLAIGQIDIVLSGIFLGTTDAGIYSIASRASRLIPFGLSAINMATAPLISRLYAEQKIKDLQRILTIAAGLILVVMLFASLVIVGFSDIILRLFGDDFGAARPALLILALGQFVNTLSGAAALLMTMTGHQIQALRVAGISLVIDFILNILLIPRYGIIGAAIATAITTATWNILLVRLVKKLVGVNPTVLTLLPIVIAFLKRSKST